MPQKRSTKMKFLNSIYGSWLKLVLTAILTMIISKGNIYEVTLEECISAAVISILPIIVNWLSRCYCALWWNYHPSFTKDFAQYMQAQNKSHWELLVNIVENGKPFHELEKIMQQGKLPILSICLDTQAAQKYNPPAWMTSLEYYIGLLLLRYS
jgi:hypothetical protein